MLLVRATKVCPKYLSHPSPSEGRKDLIEIRLQATEIQLFENVDRWMTD